MHLILRAHPEAPTGAVQHTQIQVLQAGLFGVPADDCLHCYATASPPLQSLARFSLQPTVIPLPTPQMPHQTVNTQQITF